MNKSGQLAVKVTKCWQTVSQEWIRLGSILAHLAHRLGTYDYMCQVEALNYFYFIHQACDSYLKLFVCKRFIWSIVPGCSKTILQFTHNYAVFLNVQTTFNKAPQTIRELREINKYPLEIIPRLLWCLKEGFYLN